MVRHNMANPSCLLVSLCVFQCAQRVIKYTLWSLISQVLWLLSAHSSSAWGLSYTAVVTPSRVAPGSSVQSPTPRKNVPTLCSSASGLSNAIDPRNELSWTPPHPSVYASSEAVVPATFPAKSWWPNQSTPPLSHLLWLPEPTVIHHVIWHQDSLTWTNRIPDQGMKPAMGKALTLP